MLGIKRKVLRVYYSLLGTTPEIEAERSSMASVELPDTLVVENLRRMVEQDVRKFFSDSTVNSAWEAAFGRIEPLNISSEADGVNPGDRRAIWSLVYGLQPKSVLEVGTHIGASTTHIADALNCVGREGRRLTTVDIEDVNHPEKGAWKQRGLDRSPAQLLSKLDLESIVEFQTSSSIEFLKQAKDKYDFIFLDGDHSALTVFREIPLALERLNEGGTILLHDYFPAAKPLWSNNIVIPGPFLAAQRYEEAEIGIHAIPLSPLPWPTKLGTSNTSLALLQRA